MNLLALDTSTSRASVALAVDGMIDVETQEHVREHAQCLLPMVERLLTRHQISLKHLDGIVFGRGPGSFTGLRIACSVAKGLAYAHDLPLFPVSGLSAIAYRAHREKYNMLPDVPVLAMIDARMNQVYWAIYHAETMLQPEQVTAIADIPMTMYSSLMIAGVGFEPYLAQLPVTAQACVVRQQNIYPGAETLIALVHAGYVQSVSARAAEPVYIRNQVTQGAACG